MKKKIACLLMAAMCSVCLPGCEIAGNEVVLQDVFITGKTVFSINGKKYKMTEAKLYLCNYMNLYGTAYGMNLWEYDFGEKSLEKYVKDVTLDELSRIACMEQVAQQLDIELTENEKQKVSRLAKEYLASLTGDEIAFMGIHEEDLVEFYSRYALADKLYNAMTEGKTQEVSDDEARVIRLQQIVVADKETADSIAEKLAQEEDFSALANSLNESSNGEITVARGKLPKAVEEVAFNMENGEVSGAIQTDEGYYFVKCINKYDEDLTERNKEILRVQKVKEKFEQTYTNFTEQAEVKFNRTAWEEVKVPLDKNVNTRDFFELFDKEKENALGV